MNDYYNFENLECWKQAKDLAVDMYKLAAAENLNHDLGLGDQLRKSAVSVMSNIAEGKTLGAARDYIKHLQFAKASTSALRSNLIISRDLGYLGEGDFIDLQDRTNRVSALIGGLINAIKRAQQNKNQSPQKSQEKHE